MKRQPPRSDDAMRIGVGLPSTIPGAPASLTLDWARHADAGPFSTLATLDRLVYDSLDTLSSGRFTLGIAVGARKEDYDAAGVSYASRGRRLVEQLDSLRDLWEEG